MNEKRKENLKSLILKLPLGPQLLQLRSQIILRHQVRRHNLELRREARKREIEEKNQKKSKLQRKKLLIRLKRNTEQLVRKREAIRRSSIALEHKASRLNNVRLQDRSFYRSCSVINLKKFQRYSQVPPEQATAFEIGAGLYLAAPIGLSLLGFKKVITVDIRRANPKYVRAVIKYYQKHGSTFGINRVPKIKTKITAKNLDKILWENFNIDYRAPYDAAHTDLPDNSVDYVFSQVTFEHIRVDVLPDIIKEAFRILRGGGIFHVSIDLKDHRASSNPDLTIYDYLQYTTAEWPQYDGKSHQNRLRAVDYRALFTAVGFEIIDSKSKVITDADRAAFATVKVADEFKNKYTDEELMERKVRLVLRKP